MTRGYQMIMVPRGHLTGLYYTPRATLRFMISKGINISQQGKGAILTPGT